MIESSGPRAAYVHVPFCRHRCGYCNFTVVAGRDDLIEDYLRAIQKELAALRDPRPVETLYLGGGTPSHLNPNQLGRLLDVVLRWFPLVPDAEFSMEANPVDLSTEKVDLLAKRGVNRISLGSQSFDADKLSLLERDHDADTIRAAVENCRRKIDNIALDLIFGVPGETEDVWLSDLQQVISLLPEHVSVYGLTFEKGTRFWSRERSGELSPPGEDPQAAMYESAIDQLAAAGLEHYEVSNFARVGWRSRHNETYWKGGSFFGIGPGAASYMAGVRRTNHRSTTTYLRRVLSGESPVAESEQLSPEDAARELLVFAMRRIEGVERAWFAERSGFSLDELIGDCLPRLVELGFIENTPERIRLSRKGLLVSDAIWPDFLRQ